MELLFRLIKRNNFFWITIFLCLIFSATNSSADEKEPEYSDAPSWQTFFSTENLFKLLQQAPIKDSSTQTQITKKTSLSFLSKVTRLTQEIYCQNNSELMIAPGIYAWISSLQDKIESPHQDKIYEYYKETWLGYAIIARFRTPELNYNELIAMGKKPKTVPFPYNRKAMILGDFFTKYWDLANQIAESLKFYGEEVVYTYDAFIFTGHGGGAVLATFTALVFQHKWPKRKIKLVTYGAPRIGNYFFIMYLQSRFWVERVTVRQDNVPLFFGNKYLTHTAYETWIAGDEDCDCSDINENVKPEIYRCTNFVGGENMKCNLKFEPPKPTFPEQRPSDHLGPYFNYIMSPEGCKR
ncbi:hypothetical protein G9A89_003979 [Geosiphon pyriformis]|nr:hypothetical protein G9A89_003979 [Geosiphon pyriformis]